MPRQKWLKRLQWQGKDQRKNAFQLKLRRIAKTRNLLLRQTIFARQAVFHLIHICVADSPISSSSTGQVMCFSIQTPNSLLQSSASCVKRIAVICLIYPYKYSPQGTSYRWVVFLNCSTTSTHRYLYVQEWIVL